MRPYEVTFAYRGMESSIFEASEFPVDTDPGTLAGWSVYFAVPGPPIRNAILPVLIQLTSE